MCLERCKTFINEKFLVGNKLQLATGGAFSSYRAGLQGPAGEADHALQGPWFSWLSALTLDTHCHLHLSLI